MLLAVYTLPFIAFVQSLSENTNQAKLLDKYTECVEGAYLNLCAECVSGQTEKEDDFGQDSCGVCGGFETCKQECSDPMAPFDEDFDAQKSCAKMVSMTPNILDRGESSNGLIYIFGDGISPETLDAVECNIRQDNTPPVDIKGKVLQGKVELFFPLPEEEGHYELYCNSSIGVDFKQNVLVVNSLNLKPMTVTPGTIVTWTENELTVTVSRMAGPADVICFGKDEKGEVVYREWTNAIAGNSISSTVICPHVIVPKPGQMEFGIAYSISAINMSQTVKVAVVALSPKPLTAVYKPELSKVIITFDENLDEDKITDCQSVFKDSCLSIFGKNPECTALANEIHVKLKDTSALMDTVLQFKDNVRTQFSDVAVEGSVTINGLQSEAKSSLRLAGRKTVCPGETTEVILEGNQVGKPIWKLNLVGKNLSDIPVGQRQRLNLIQWRMNRSSKASAKSLDLSADKLSSGMKYQVSATTKDPKGTDKVASLEVRVADPGESWTQIMGPREIDIRTTSVYEAIVRSCGKEIKPIKYAWEITNTKGDKVDTSFQNGPKLLLDGSSLLPNEEYKVEVEAWNTEKMVGKDSLNILTTLKTFELHLAESSIVIGTGQLLEIDAAKSIEISPNMVKFKWKCKTGYCYEPGKVKKSLNNQDSFSSPVLKLSPKSIAIGRYVLELEAQRDSEKAKAEVEVTVINGQPPHFDRLSISELNPGKDLTIKLDVMEVLGRCVFYWQGVPDLGFSFISVNKMSTIVEGSPTSPSASSLNLTVPSSTLRPGAKYKLRAVADCGRFAQSHFDFRIFVPERFPDMQLEIEPLKGVALETEFVYKVVFNHSEGKYLFNFGFEENNTSKILHFAHSNEYKTIFGHGAYKPFVKVCRSKRDCIMIPGPEISTEEPSNLDENELNHFVQNYNNLIMGENFPEALAYLEMVVPSIKEKDMKLYEAFSMDIQKIIENRIEVYTSRLNSEKCCVEDSVRLLNAATSALTILANNDEAMSAVLKFRDDIHESTLIMSEKKTENVISASLPAEPREVPAVEMIQREKRDIIIKENTEQAVKAILNVASSLDNMSNNTEQKLQEKRNTLRFIMTYASTFCNEIENSQTKEAVSETGYGLVASTRISKLNKMKIPQCKTPCPNITGSANVMPANNPQGKKNGDYCFATAYLRDDILSDISPKSETIVKRWGPVFWLDLLPYTNGAVPVQNNYKYLIPPSNVTYNRTTANDSEAIIKRGNIMMQMPLSNEPKPNGTILKCFRYENGAWNSSSCFNKTMKAPQRNFLICQCPYPGYYSVFAVYENSTTNSTVLPSNENSSLPSTIVTPTVSPLLNNATKSITNDPQISTTALSITTIKPETLANNKTIVMNGTTSVSNETRGNTKTTNLTSNEVHVTSNNSRGISNESISTTKTSNISKTTKKAPKESLNTTEVPNKSINTTKVTNGTSNEAAVTVKPLPPVTTSKSSENTTNAPVKVTTGMKNMITSSVNASLLSTTAFPKLENVTQLPSHYKYLASFRINESYTEKVGKHENEFLQNLDNQLKSNANVTFPTAVEPEKDLIKVTLQIEEDKLKNENYYLASLSSLLKNGSLTLKGLDGEVLNVPIQSLQLSETSKHTSAASTTFIFILFVFLILLVGSLIMAIYLRMTRDQRTSRTAQDLYQDPPAPKYLRLHDSVSLGSSGPSSPSNGDMESSLAVVTRSNRSRGYEAMDQFSNLPGNI